MEKQPKPNKIKNIRPETLEFIMLYEQLRGKAFSNNSELAEVLGFNNASSITEIVKRRQNIDPEKFRLFKEKYHPELPASDAPGTTTAFARGGDGIPMYDLSNNAGGLHAYQDINHAQPVGRMNFPGIEECDFALPVWGHAMHPYLENGCWVALKVIHDKTIVPGEVYYVEWGDYRMFKRLLMSETPGEVTAHSDNVTEMTGNRPRYAPFSIRLADIKKLCLVKDIHKKHNH